MTFLSKEIYHSVIFQILMAMLLIASMALASMALSVYVILDTQDDAEAINLAGSLRMQSYRISHLLYRASQGTIDDPAAELAREQREFSEKLYNSIVAESIHQSGNTPLKKSYQRVTSNWQQSINPLLASIDGAGNEIPWPRLAGQYNQKLVSYVDDIDQMVTHLQRNTEGKIELLGVTEGMSIFLIVFIMIFFIMKADSNFIVPLRGLVEAAQKVEAGDLAHRTTYTGDNELGLLSNTFNSMTASLEAQYRTLEEQVAERTDKLRKSNQALNFLYKTSRDITSSPYDQRLLGVFLEDLRKVVGAQQINLCINAEPNFADYEVITTLNKSDVCINDCDVCELAPGRGANAIRGNVSLPLKSRDEQYGFLFVQSRDGKELDAWQNQLLRTAAETLSTAFAFHHTLDQDRRLILLEERSTIARELHDSLAQSLSYMKLEVARLKKMIKRDYEPSRVEEAISDLQEGLSAAYKHLRELLVTFRVKLDAPNLRSALAQAVEEFDAMGPATVTLDYALGGYAMSANEDIHVLHILREALNNAVKHARADSIILSCSRNNSGEAVFTVDDDGVGMSEHPEKEHHYGIYTMRERAQRVNGVFNCARRPSGGTRVELRMSLPPDLLRA